MTTGTQDKFRKELIKRDQFCILSGLCHEVCEAAHLVNKECIKPSCKSIMFNPHNGILLNSNLHKEFDMNFWTIDMNAGSWDIIKKDIDFEKTKNYKCDIKLHPIGQKKLDTNMKLEIFTYLKDGINVPVECIPFVITRNIIYKNRYLTEHVDLSQIDIALKIEYKTKRATKTKRKRIKSPGKPVKKRVRYSKIQKELISTWIKGLHEKPHQTQRHEFCEKNNLENKIFEARFSKLWKKYNI